MASIFLGVSVSRASCMRTAKQTPVGWAGCRSASSTFLLFQAGQWWLWLCSLQTNQGFCALGTQVFPWQLQRQPFSELSISPRYCFPLGLQPHRLQMWLLLQAIDSDCRLRACQYRASLVWHWSFYYWKHNKSIWSSAIAPMVTRLLDAPTYCTRSLVADWGISGSCKVAHGIMAQSAS